MSTRMQIWMERRGVYRSHWPKLEADCHYGRVWSCYFGPRSGVSSMCVQQRKVCQGRKRTV